MTGLVEAIAPARFGTSFRWLLGSSWTSNMGDGIALASGPLLVASETDDPLLVALALVLQRLPWLLFGLLAGVVADRSDRRRIMVLVHAVRAAVLLGLVIAVVLERVDIVIVLAVMFVLGTAEVFGDTTSQTLLPMVVDADQLGVANARIMTGHVTVNQLIGPPIGAALFTVEAFVPFVAQAACMAGAALLASRIPLPAHGGHGPRSRLRREVAEGFGWLWAHGAIRTLAITIVTFNLTFGAAWSVLVLYARERLDTGEIGFGLLTTAVAIGSVLGTASYGWLTTRASLGNLMRAGLIIETLTHAALAITTSIGFALAVMFVFGAHAMVWGTTSTSIRQRAVPTALQGRVSAVYLIGLQGGLFVGSLLGGVIAEAWGLTAPFWFAFAGSAVLVVVIWRQLPLIAHAGETETSPATS